MDDLNRNVLPLLTVLEAIFSTGEPSDRFEAVLQAAVHGWMEGHLSAPGHVVSGDTTEEMPAPPYPPRESAALRAILHEVMGRFGSGEEPGAALCAAARGWQAGRQAGLDCPGCALENADQPVARAIRAGRGEYRFHPDDALRARGS